MDRLATRKASWNLFVGMGHMARIINIFTLTAASWALAAGIVLAVWHILDDRVDIAASDDAQAVVLHDPNPPMTAWRPHIHDSVGTTTFATAVSGTGLPPCEASDLTSTGRRTCSLGLSGGQ